MAAGKTSGLWIILVKTETQNLWKSTNKSNEFGLLRKLQIRILEVFNDFTCFRRVTQFWSLPGTYNCGICHCEPGYLGARCECQEGEASTIYLNACREAEGKQICSGRGECSCNQCLCYKSEFGKIFGSFCECDDFSCARHKGILCSGKSRITVSTEPVRLGGDMAVDGTAVSVLVYAASQAEEIRRPSPNYWLWCKHKPISESLSALPVCVFLLVVIWKDEAGQCWVTIPYLP